MPNPQRPIPEVGPKDVLIEVKKTGICELQTDTTRPFDLANDNTATTGGSDVHCK